MRVSTAQIFDSGTRGLQRNQFDLYKVQNQLSTGRRVLTPEDDPVGAAQALVISQSKDLTTQYLKNQDDARSKLGLVEGQLSSVTDLLQNVRERLIQAGNTTLSNSDRAYIAQELEARFSELMGLANAQDGSGNYLFSGYKGATRPFASIAGGASYLGDEGQRLLQVETTRQLPISLAGSEVFQNIKNGNGTFVTATGGALANLGTSTASNGSLTDVLPVTPGTQWAAGLVAAPWSVPANAGDIRLEFSKNATTGATEYQLFDVSDPAAPKPMIGTFSAPTWTATPQPYVSGAAIPLRYVDATGTTIDLGATIAVTGTALPGDRYEITPDATAPNGVFSVSAGVNRLTPPGNTGTGLIDKGSVSSFALWRNALETTSYWNDPESAGQFQIRFSVDAVTGKTQYQLFDYSDPVYPTAMSAAADYEAGASISLRLEPGYGSNPSTTTDPNARTIDFGAFVVVSGQPAAGDTFQVSPSVNQSMFSTLRNAIDVLKRGVGGEFSPTQFTNDLGKELINLDQALENVSKSRSTVGTSLRELDSLTNAGEDKQLQYSETLSNLQDLDYAAAITELSRKQMQLQAAQLSFKQTSQLSLFNIL